MFTVPGGCTILEGQFEKILPYIRNWITISQGFLRIPDSYDEKSLFEILAYTKRSLFILKSGLQKGTVPFWITKRSFFASKVPNNRLLCQLQR